MRWRSPFSISSSEPGFSATDRLPTVARPEPAMTKHHCSARGCSLTTSSEVLCPGRSVIIAACASPVLYRTLKKERIEEVVMWRMKDNLATDGAPMNTDELFSHRWGTDEHR